MPECLQSSLYMWGPTVCSELWTISSWQEQLTALLNLRHDSQAKHYASLIYRNCIRREQNHHLKIHTVFQRVEFSIHSFPNVSAPWWEGTRLSCLSQALGRNSFQGCSPENKGSTCPLAVTPNPEPRPRSFWEGFLGCSAALQWQQLWLRAVPAKCATKKDFTRRNVAG